MGNMGLWTWNIAALVIFTNIFSTNILQVIFDLTSEVKPEVKNLFQSILVLLLAQMESSFC